MIEWNRLTDVGFESLCYDILVREGYKNIRWIGGTGDRGTDIVAEKTEKIAGTKELTHRCVVQCKKYLKRSPGPSDLNSTLAWADAHDPHILLIMLSNTLTAETRDWLDKIEPKKRYRIFVLEEKDFEQFFDNNNDLYEKHFGKERIPRKKMIIFSLLNEERKTLETIANETQLSKEEVVEILDELEQGNVVSREGLPGVASYYLKRTITAYVDAAKQFLADEMKFEFLASQYSKSMINSELVNHIGSRYHLVLLEDHKTALIKLFKISSSALNAALFWPTDIYETGYSQIQKLEMNEEQRNKCNKLFVTSFFSLLLENALTDLRDPNVKKILHENEVEGYSIGVDIRMANPNTSVLSLQSKAVFTLQQAAGAIRAGQIVSATSPDLFKRVGDILLHMEMFDDAIPEYDRAISEVKDVKKLAEAWNNKGVCLIGLGRTGQARPCFEKALEVDPTLKEARENLHKCDLIHDRESAS